MIVLKRLFTHGATLLAASALLSKVLSFIRDRLVLQTFPDLSTVDAIYASFRIPDFLFFLFIASTISVIFIPRIEQTPEKERSDYIASFLWGIVIIFGIACILGILALPTLVPWLFGGLDFEAQTIVITLSRWLFGASFLLSINALFSAYLQWQEKFWPVALAPLLYMGGVVLGLFFFGKTLGPNAMAYGAIFGALLSLLISHTILLQNKVKLLFKWRKPKKSWKGFGGDFTRRVLAGSAFQINQTIDVIIASRLIQGSIASFSIGTALGHFLLSVVGYSVSNALFPRLSKAKDIQAQWPIMLKGIKMILFITIPASLIAILLTPWALTFLFKLEGERLWMTQMVFQFTVASLPFACLIPLFSRSFLARNDTRTPLIINYLSLTIATALAAYLSLVTFSGVSSIMGLAIGNFVANTLSFGLFGLTYYQKHKVHVIKKA